MTRGPSVGLQTIRGERAATWVEYLPKPAQRKLRRWHALFRALHPPLDIPSTVAVLLAQELEFRRLIAPSAFIPVRIERPVPTRLRLRPTVSDLTTLQEVMKHEVYGALPELLPSPQWIIDLGAHIGLSSLYFLGRYPTVKVLAVEPHPGNFALLQNNLRPWIDSARCRAVCAAAWSRDCALRPTVCLNEPNQASFSVQLASAEESGSIRGLSMATLIGMTGAAEVQLVKMDIEGSEAALLTRDASWLRAVQCLAIEFHDDLRAQLCFDELMTTYGFDIVHDGEHTVIALVRRPVHHE
jgi:FkbM family methyltransferase